MMTQQQQKEHTLFWLIRPEDSSNWEARTMQSSSGKRRSQGMYLSVSKFLLCYATALAAAVLLSRLH